MSDLINRADPGGVQSLEDSTGESGPSRRIRIAALIKQVPIAEEMTLTSDGRLARDGVDHEMNPYCRRAVSKGVELAQLFGGTCTVFTLGPPSADDVLREAIAWGADSGVHLCDPAFAGSDTLATATALAAALRLVGPFDLILVGRNSIDGDTGQVGPEVAQMLDLAFAGGVKKITGSPPVLDLDLELDDGAEKRHVYLPAVLSVAERLCDPCKVDPDRRKSVPADRIRRLAAADLGDGAFGDAGSPTKVGAVRLVAHQRAGVRLDADVSSQVAAAVQLLVERGALSRDASPAQRSTPRPSDDLDGSHRDGAESADRVAVDDRAPVVAVIVEPGRVRVAEELVGAAGDIAGHIGARVVAISPDLPRCGGAIPARDLAALGADDVVELVAAPGDGGPDLLVEEDVAAYIATWASQRELWAVLAPSTAFGREVAGRAAAALGTGLVGDAIGLDVRDGNLVAAKPAFSGALVADITCDRLPQMVTVRPGVLVIRPSRAKTPAVSRVFINPVGRVRVVSTEHNDDVEVLARADVVIGIGQGVDPSEYSSFSTIAAILGAELAATRKVTDKGWAPRARQVGITGRSIAPRLYVAVALSGKYNHIVGVRSAGTILAINSDPDALVFDHCDVGIVGDFHDVIPALEDAVRSYTGTLDPAGSR